MDLVDRERGSEMTVDLEQQVLTLPGGELVHFPFDPFQRHRLLNGLDDIALTLEREPEIGEFEHSHEARVDTLALR
jgi:3-isopropylmalate dehydratase small subunit